MFSFLICHLSRREKKWEGTRLYCLCLVVSSGFSSSYTDWFVMALGNALGMHEKMARSFWNAWSVYRKFGTSRGRLMAYISTDLEGSIILGEPCPFHCLYQSQTVLSSRTYKDVLWSGHCLLSSFIFFVAHPKCVVLEITSLARCPYMCLPDFAYASISITQALALCTVHAVVMVLEILTDLFSFLPCFCKGFFMLSQCLLDHLPYTAQSTSLQVLQRRFSWVEDSERAKKLIVFLVEECFPSIVSREKIRKIDKVIHGTRKIPVLSSFAYMTKTHFSSFILNLDYGKKKKTLWPPFSFLLHHIKTS